MAVGDSNTFILPKITDDQSLVTGEFAELLKMPLDTTHDLFQVLDICQRLINELIEDHNHAEFMALCRRLLAGFNVLKVVLNAPLPKYLVEQLTVNESNADEYRSPRSTDSKMTCEYCYALTMMLMNQQISLEEQDNISELLFELLLMMTEDLKAPRFIRTANGLVMISGEVLPGVH